MAFGKKNVIKIDPLNYNIGLLGESGIGKTTIIKEACEKLAGEDGYLFVECGKEDGADAISNINYINCPEWEMEYDEYTNSVGFSDLINDILENKNRDYPNLRTIVIDTYDQLREIVIPEIIRRHNKEYPEKRTRSIKACFGGYMAGDDMADELVLDMLWSLKKVGVHFIIIGHVKLKDVTSVTGETFNQLTTNMSNRSFNAIKTKLHFLGIAYIDREIVKEKIIGKKDKTKNVVKSETRKIIFRDDNYSLDSKSRFADITNEPIPFDVDEFIKAITDAIKAEAEKGNKSVADLKKEQDKAAKAHEKVIAAAEEENRSKKELETVISSIIDACKADKDLAKSVVKECKELGYSNPKEVDDLEVAKKLLAMCE